LNERIFVARKDGHKIARGLVAPTCPEVDAAFEACIKVVKERGTELLREALEEVCQEKADLEEEKEDLEKKVGSLESEIEDLKQEVSNLRQELRMYE
jgi:chaperonin cofactor prefoldin